MERESGRLRDRRPRTRDREMDPEEEPDRAHRAPSPRAPDPSLRVRARKQKGHGPDRQRTGPGRPRQGTEQVQGRARTAEAFLGHGRRVRDRPVPGQGLHRCQYLGRGLARQDGRGRGLGLEDRGRKLPEPAPLGRGHRLQARVRNRERRGKRRVGSSLLRSKKTNIMKEFGGGPVFGVNGIAIVAHGSSSPTAIANGISTVSWLTKKDYVNQSIKELSSIRGSING